MPDHIGQQLGNYRLTRLLGTGGFAEVYLGEHLYLKTYAAVKVLFASPTEKQEQEFLTEAQTLARLTHPNIIRVREFAVVRGTPFLAMDYAPGGTLRQNYSAGSSLSLQQTVAYIKQIAAALQYAHNNQIIHRDIKPENFLFDAQRNVKLSDFGISLLSSPVEHDVAGTLPYMAPEQRTGKASFASDQYSLGIVAYEWLCGVRPFEEVFAPPRGYIAPPRLREKDPSLPEAVEVVVLKALARDPQDRYPSVLQFARALEIAVQRSVSRSTVSDEVASSFHSDVPRRVFFSIGTSPTGTRPLVTDDPLITQIKADLEARDIIVESDTSEEEKVRLAIREAQLVLLVSSSQTQPLSTFNEHLRIANIYRRHAVYIGTSGNNGQALLPAPTEHITVIDQRQKSYKQAIDEIVKCLEHERRRTPLPETVPSQTEFEPRNPYKGLHAFTQDDASDFFGREALVQEIAKSLVLQLQPTSLNAPGKRLLTVIGPSGSGKSSVVMAGLLPRLRRGALPSSETWIYLDPMLPGQDPLGALANVFASRFPNKTIQQVRDILSTSGSYGLHQLATALIPNHKTRVVLFIDQFEELFSSDVPEQERKLLIDLLVTAVTQPRGPLLVLLTLRADFYHCPLAYPALGQLIQQHQYTVLPMEIDDLGAVIERPASLPDVWLTFEGGLIGDILFEMRGQVGALPLLEFTLDQLFQRRQGHYLTLQAYQEIGGVKGALSKHAESTYAALPTDKHRQLAHALFVRLITPGTTEQQTEQQQTPPVRRRAPIEEFAFADPAQNRLMQETIDAFLAARLLTTNQTAKITTLEVNHEALISEWPRLLNWIGEAQKDIHLQQMLSSDVAEWGRLGKPKDHLYSPLRLKEFKDWQEHNFANRQEVTFLNESSKQQTRARIRVGAIILLVLLLLIPTIAFTVPLIFSSTVTNLDDDGTGSLRQVLANAKPGSTITFAPWLRGGTILLKSALYISQNITIKGPGADLLAMSFGDQTGTDQEESLHISRNLNVSISGITLKDSKISGEIIYLRKGGTLTLTGCAITNNTSDYWPPSNANEFGETGGIIYNQNGTLTLIQTTVSGNTVRGHDAAGAIASLGGTVALKESTISGNQVTATQTSGTGGGISSYGSKITLDHSHILNNTVKGNQGAGGGGISLISDQTTQQGSLTLNDSTISGNIVTVTSDQQMPNGASPVLSQGEGGGIASKNSTVSIKNSTISGNTAIGGQGGIGGGLDFDGVQATISSSTINGNTATTSGGGLSINDTRQSSNVVMKNTSITKNTANTNPDVSGTVASG